MDTITQTEVEQPTALDDEPATGDEGAGGPRRGPRRRSGRRLGGRGKPRHAARRGAEPQMDEQGAPATEAAEAVAAAPEAGPDDEGSDLLAEGAQMRGSRARRGGKTATAGQGGNRQRLHKVLAQTGLGSRREMESLIAQGQVQVNGQTATIGQTVEPGDRIHVKRRRVNASFGDDQPRVLIYHKPPGEIVTRDDPEGRPTVFQNLKAPDHGKWIPVGRLDFNSEGLLLFTTYGELANRLMHPRYQVVREYSVRVLGELTPEQEDQLLDGIELEDGPARVLSLEAEGGEGANRWYRLTLQEGRNREVRRMFEALGLTVSRLIRIRYGDIRLPSWLKRGQSKLLDEAETFNLLTSVGLRSNSARAQLKRALKGKPVPTAHIGVMRNAREHELAREGRLADDPAQRTRKTGRGKRRVDALATSFGFDLPAAHGKRLGGGGGARHGLVVPGIQAPAPRSKRRSKTITVKLKGGKTTTGSRSGNNHTGRAQSGATPQIDYAGLPRDEE